MQCHEKFKQMYTGRGYYDQKGNFQNYLEEQYTVRPPFDTVPKTMYFPHKLALSRSKPLKFFTLQVPLEM